MKDGKFRDTNTWKLLRTVLEAAVLAAIIVGILFLAQTVGLADEEYEERYVLCMDQVNIRMGPSRSSCDVGWLECCDTVWTDGRKKNGYIHVYGTFEAGEGWIHSGYLVDNKPIRMMANARIISKGRLAARKYVDGKRTRWLKAGAKLKVYWWSNDWCLTNCGYVQSMFLDIGGE